MPRKPRTRSRTKETIAFISKDGSTWEMPEQPVACLTPTEPLPQVGELVTKAFHISELTRDLRDKIKDAYVTHLKDLPVRGRTIEDAARRGISRRTPRCYGVAAMGGWISQTGIFNCLGYITRAIPNVR